MITTLFIIPGAIAFIASIAAEVVKFRDCLWVSRHTFDPKNTFSPGDFLIASNRSRIRSWLTSVILVTADEAIRKRANRALHLDNVSTYVGLLSVAYIGIVALVSSR